jgi:hypothetical protein
MVVIVTAIISGTILTGVFLQAIVSIYSKRRDSATSGLPSGATARIEERLFNIEQAVEAVAVEVERISEGQRFTTKLLSERVGERV